MRINVYNEEMTEEVSFVEKYVQETGKTYYGLRMYMESSPKLHHTATDDDRTAITMWFGTKIAAVEYFQNVTSALEKYITKSS